ncbi:hypothetical protein Kpho02_04140 [Kitasatospora phosalacinea]|uniref:Uncharacterized protein n=1 Tax=Kitasatospora phosalacinea TaxID=2065 RepID=A0A9W6Q186_9ACTN|nr:hypothetical protein [Kitasatospora phosalacinea]GLW68115.1 hypothetical protein Kpho02_04140 [Kitasatospora phosalacinea]
MEFTALRRSDSATVRTPLGELVLHRSPEKVAPGVWTPGLRDWRLELDGRPLGGLPGFAPGPRAVRAARRGRLTADFEGAEARVTARSRHLLRSRRYVQFEVGGRTLCFVRRGLVRTELLEGGRTVGRTRLGSWELAEPDPLRVFATAVYAWGGLDHANDNPLLPDVLSELLLAPLS